MSDELLRQLIAGQKEQTELFRRYLWRLRFSLLALLLLMTLTAVGLGIGVYLTRPKANTIPTFPTVPPPAPSEPDPFG